MYETMKKKRWYLIYIAAVLMLAAFPFVGMSVAASNETTENKELARFPRLRFDGTNNISERFHCGFCILFGQTGLLSYG